MKRHVVGSIVLSLLFLSIPAFAQNPLVGTWEAFGTVDGKETVPPAPDVNGIQQGVQHWMFSADGFYVMLRINKGRPQTTTPQDQWTKEDWQKQYKGTFAQYGTYSISGDTLTTRLISAMNPSNEGKDTVYTFRKDGADYVLTRTGASGSKIEQRWRRVK